ncbi:VWA domain-containing protein [Ponticaulis sp.]|uniref:vWA domain-containing protein n=1 Tax=Ponticaulis sp. TaxID=2020902 RepID=UPI000B664F77|nr:VWA domain-containing protein [Ponticaulis sp.]MAI89502.1 hypothetical protein [Ponticaulis sp.]OUY00537.1 MAG: hypothetical protein CBB65_03600 [Hyphomonadaceae bacterium TMED5]|tara:strand:- start:159321 stop:160664 length:1344 start_codon:yes stop_codon:yes gene_type:complete
MTAERTITDFVRALRSADVNVSPAETIDAARTVDLVGYQDRGRLKISLRNVLAKSETEKLTYDRLFDLFFSRRRSENSSQSEGDDAQAEGHEAPQDFMDLAGGDESSIEIALEKAGQEVGLQDIRFSTQTSYFAQQMLKAMGVAKMEKDLLERLQEHTPEGDATAEDMMQARRKMTARAVEYAKRQFDVFGAGATQQFREDFLAEKRINEMDRSDLDRMKPLVEKLAKRLVTKHSRRKRQKNRGQIDIRRTLRANAGRDGIPFDVHWKQTRKDRPKLVLICDVSGSVAQYVRFLLLFLYCMRDVVPDLYTYAFSARLKDVGPYLDTSLDGFDNAMQRILDDAGWGSTDYGQALSDLRVDFWNKIDRRTTIIVLGDGRSNHGDPRLDIFEDAAGRCKRIVWLNPEAKSLWGTGDSEMLRYQPHCSTVTTLSTLKQLERAIDDVLMHYS